MIDIFYDSSIITFIATALIIMVIPGPTLLLVIAITLQLGAPAVSRILVSILAADFISFFISYVSLSLLAIWLHDIFYYLSFISITGLFYLGYLAIKKSQNIDDITYNNKFYITLFMVTVTNPKVYAFYLSFLPQFINYKIVYTLEHVLLYSFSYSLLFAVMGASVATCYALATSYISANITNPKHHQLYARLSGFFMMGLAIFFLFKSIK